MNAKLKQRESAPGYLHSLIYVLIIYISVVYLFTLTPFQFSRFYFHQYLLFKKGYLATLTGTTSIRDVIINLLMLAPIGFIVASIFKTESLSFRRSLTFATALGFFLSLTIEFSQIFLPRMSSTIDVFNNTLGAAIGGWIVYYKKSYDPRRLFNRLSQFAYTWRFGIMLVYAVVVSIIFLLPIYGNDFSNWDSEYSLLIGNEKTMDRSWRGAIFKVSLFNRVLQPEEVKRLYSVGFSERTPEEQAKGLLAEYLFTEIPVKNSVAGGPASELFPVSDSQIYRLGKHNGFYMAGNSALCTKGSNEKLVDLFQRTNQLTIAVWLTPDNLQMAGPARVVSLSLDPSHRNFTLGQSHDRINFRVRTPLTGINGAKVNLTTGPLLSEKRIQFIVATFHRGEAHLFFNGKHTESTIYSTSFYLPLLFGYEKKRYIVLEICFLLLFPLGLFVWGTAASRLWQKALAAVIVIVPFLVSSIFKLLLFNHGPDVYLFTISSFLAVLVLMSGFVFDVLVYLLKINHPLKKHL